MAKRTYNKLANDPSAAQDRLERELKYNVNRTSGLCTVPPIVVILPKSCNCVRRLRRLRLWKEYIEYLASILARTLARNYRNPAGFQLRTRCPLTFAPRLEHRSEKPYLPPLLCGLASRYGSSTLHLLSAGVDKGHKRVLPILENLEL